MDCVSSLMSFRGLWIPSKIEPKIPGPSSTDKGFPVRSTGSPTVTPDVSSYTWLKNSLMNNDTICKSIYMYFNSINPTPIFTIDTKLQGTTATQIKVIELRKLLRRMLFFPNVTNDEIYRKELDCFSFKTVYIWKKISIY